MAAPAANSDESGFIDRLRARMPWFDHVIRAQERYRNAKGDFYAAGITYFTIFAIFPLLMVGFAVAGFVLASHPQWIDEIKSQITSAVSGDIGEQLVQLMESAIASRTSVGIIGLATAAWVGLGWMNNMREALSQMWGRFRAERPSFVKTKLSDLVRLLSLFGALVLTFALTALGNPSMMRNVLGWFGIPDGVAPSVLLTVASQVMSVLVSWLLFTWVIARLPRESVSLHSSVRAGLIAAIGFEIFKQVGSVYLRSVLTGPAGVAFGPLLGLMVFAYITARMVLLATAWAATSKENMDAQPEQLLPPPAPAVINNRVIARPALRREQAAWAALAGALGALGLSRLFRRRR